MNVQIVAALILSKTGTPGRQTEVSLQDVVRRTLTPEAAIHPSAKQKLRAHYERSSSRGLERTFGVRRQTVSKWLKKVTSHHHWSPHWWRVTQMMLELDEMWSFVGNKQNKRWIWIALCRQTRQVVSYFIGDRKVSKLLASLALDSLLYRHCQTFR